MKRRYSRDFSPPAPMLPLTVRVPGGSDGKHLEGKIDSGADMCVIPEDVVAELDLAPVRSVRVAGFAGAFRQAMLYHCALDFGEHRFEHVEALATGRRYALIGRNVLRHLVVTLDGPASALTITGRKPAKRRARRG